MQVKDLAKQVEVSSPIYTNTTLGMLEYKGTSVIDKASGRELGFSEDSFGNFLKYLTIPAKFLYKLPSPLQTEVVNHMLGKWEDSPAIISTYGDEFWNLYNDKTMMISNKRMAEVVTDVFDGDAKISKASFLEGMVLNIQTSEVSTAVKPGDITNGGIRLYAPLGKNPYVSAYMERLVCSNGMVATNEWDALSIRGRTVDEVIKEMEYLARKVLTTDIPAYLDNWKQMQEIKSSNPEQLIHRLVREAGVNEKIESVIIDRANALESNSYYDVVNLITSLQHEEGVSESQLFRLQALGGNAVRDLGGHRCNNCQHSLA